MSEWCKSEILLHTESSRCVVYVCVNKCIYLCTFAQYIYRHGNKLGPHMWLRSRWDPGDDGSGATSDLQEGAVWSSSDISASNYVILRRRYILPSYLISAIPISEEKYF
jgi:hypothetical protein